MSGRLDLNYPPTSVGGISKFSHSLGSDRVSTRVITKSGEPGRYRSRFGIRRPTEDRPTTLTSGRRASRALSCGLLIARFTIPAMLGRPEPNEAAPYYYGYINRVASDDVVSVLENQLEETVAFLGGISEEQSLHRYEPGKWSIRQLLNHVNDTERIFLFRALWFARGFPNPLPGYDQDIGVAAAGADEVSWAAQVEEFRSIRLASRAFLRNLPADAWLRSGIANDNPATVRALAYIIAGHVAHHTEILKQRYL